VFRFAPRRRPVLLCSGPHERRIIHKKRATTAQNGANMSEKAPESYQLVLINGKKEEVLFSSPKLLDVELKREQHIRSITTGHVEIRKV
jgi:hypothetical protein